MSKPIEFVSPVTLSIKSNITPPSYTPTKLKYISSLSINPEFLQSVDKEELEELLVTVFNKVLAQADQVSQTEMQAVTHEMMGGLGNLFGK